VRCYECIKICPTAPKSIAVDGDRIPAHRYDTCIRCYCCQETCPANAITIRHKLFV
jgi:NAD-dependent dihydropyrimidine dehydrogenase PreA subunit